MRLNRAPLGSAEEDRPTAEAGYVARWSFASLESSQCTSCAVVEKCTDTGLLVGYVPGFLGAHTQGATLDELAVNLREVVVLAPLVAATLFFGVYPKPIFDMTGASVASTLDGINTKLQTTETAASVRTVP